ncbi:hypothetical protein QBC38DRAFT_365111, partial [Podospora fimiseda]
GKGAAGRIAINKSLGRILGKGFLANDSANGIETVWNHVRAVLDSPLEEIEPYKSQLQDYLDNKLEKIAQLPLWISHYDLNEVNIIIDNDCQVTGLIDWELSTPLPFGVNLGRIHTIAGEYTGGEFWMPPEFEEAERGFWAEIFEAMPNDICTWLEKHIDLVQDAVILGTLLNTFIVEEGVVMVSKVSLKATPKFLTYRIPLVRGSEPPYSV